MKKFLLTALAGAVTLAAAADGIPAGSAIRPMETVSVNKTATSFKEKFGLDHLPHSFIKSAPGRAKGLPAKADEALITNPQGKMSRYAMACNIYLSNLGSAHVGGFGAEVTVSDDGSEFFSRAFTLNFFQQGYSMGEIKGDSVVFESGQYIYNTADNEKAYMYGAYLAEDDDWPELTETFVLRKDDQGRYVSAPGCYFMVLKQKDAMLPLGPETDYICFATDYVFTPLPADLRENTLPADAEIMECQFSANSLSEMGGMTMKDITVGIKGDNIYIGGLTSYLPDAYLMGTKTGPDTYTFDSHQYISYYDEGDYPYLFEFTMVNPIFFDDDYLAYSEVESVVMTFNEKKTMLTLEEDAGIFICSYGDLPSWDKVYWNVKIGDFNQSMTPTPAFGVECYGSYGTPYLIFEWSNMSKEGLPMIGDNLWAEIIINGKPYEFTPEYYEGLKTSTDKVYYTTSDIDGIYAGSYSTIYLYEYEGKYTDIKTIGVRIGYDSGSATNVTDIVYASGFEPFEDKAFEPSQPIELVYYDDYYNNIKFKYDDKDVDGNEIPARLLTAEIFLDGKPLVFKNSDYYFHGDGDTEETMIGLNPSAMNYNNSLVSHFNGEYLISLWGHDEIPEFKELAVRIVCTGGDTFTYGPACELNLERPATPANPWDVTFDESYQSLVFGALPIDTDGNGLAPWKYGYEVYVNESLYTFEAALYDLDTDITVIPYEGFEYNYDFYLNTETVYDETDWSVIDKKVKMDVDMGKGSPEISKIGVRAVYTDETGNTTYSKIVNSDGTFGDVSGIETSIEGAEPVRWFNLQGIEVARPEAGSVFVRKQGGKTTKVFVK